MSVITQTDMCESAHQRPVFTRHSCPVPTHKNSINGEDNMKGCQVEADSGICTTLNDKLRESFSNYSVSRRSSACSATYATSGQETTHSSAYSSAGFSCCETDARQKQTCEVSKPAQRSRPKSGASACETNLNANNNYNASFRPENLNTDLATCNLMARLKVNATGKPQVTTVRRRSRPLSSGSSVKSDHLGSEDNRILYDANNDTAYEKKRLLGKGGFARVYEVVQSCSEGQKKRVTCAAKVIDKSRLVRPQQREKVDLEVELLKATKGHPNVVEYFHSFEDESSICILLEVCSRKSLAQYLRKKQHLSESEVCNITKQIVSGLAHLHGKGILHRDLKLGNILLTEDMSAKIGDFGLATRIDSGKKKTICGTPNFIAPEVLQRQGHGPEADIWALGCLLYTLLVGKPPFETACLRDTYRCILKNSYRIPSTVSQEAADLVRWLLRHKPKSRPTLDEIKTHPFFAKHSVRFDKVDMTRCEAAGFSAAAFNRTPAMSSSRNGPAGQRIPEETASDIVSNESGSPARDTETTLPGDACTTRSPVRRLADKLQKQLFRVTSPRKCVRAATTGLKESKKSTKPGSQEASTAGKQQNVGPSTWISKWVDYSNRYGFGYQLANGRICVLFNDGKHLALIPGGKMVMEYVSSESSGAIRFPADRVPPALERYANMLRNFTTYMEKNLSRNADPAAASSAEADARLLTWFRTDDYVAMYLSDGTLQVNFCKDHVKVNISQLHRQSAMRFTVVDEERNISYFSAESSFPGNLCVRLPAMHELFHQMFTDVNCDSHPFCRLCRQNCSPSEIATAV